MPWKLGPDSFHKCVAWFSDGNTRTFYSLDWIHVYTKNKDEELGLKRLHKMIDNWGAKAQTVIIYDTRTNKEVETYHSGIKQPQKTVQ